LLASVPEEARNECWWYVGVDAIPVPGDAGGGVELLSSIRLTRPVGHFLRAIRASAVLDALDKLLARNRARLGRFVPDGPAPLRYP